jgi:pullulanase/glycogen debranching enzyme
MEDLVIIECHLRDLLGLYTHKRGRASYSSFCEWLCERDNYLVSLGPNALELQPLQECDSVDDASYNWGYMPVNYFSPTRIYACDKMRASQIKEFAKLVETCHRRNFAVILDVVYNHVGHQNPLLLLGGRYFFRVREDGSFSNCSGCGNDLRTEAPMARKLILESLCYFLDVFAVDGFRFDLAELIDHETRCIIESTLRRKKPDVLLIAEPWSFRGTCTDALKHTTWSSWNDDFREFVKRYVCGRENHDGLKYFIAGSAAQRVSVPSQSINYCSSHDDRTWIDCVTENSNNDGILPTDVDLRRTRLVFTILFCCLGVPMLAQGQDFMHSKRGASNTYLDAELNLLDKERLEQFFDMHTFVADWIRFRTSKHGRLLRTNTMQSENFFLHFESSDSLRAIGTLYNASHSEGQEQLLFFCNPEMHSVHFDLRGLFHREHFRLIATEKGFAGTECSFALQDTLHLGELSVLFLLGV